MNDKKWIRWQDWVALVAGIVLVLTPLWFDPGTTFGLWSMIVLGGVLGIAALWSLAMPRLMASEWVHAGLGVLVIVAPWVADFAAETGAALTSWIVGAVAIAVGLEVILEYQRTHRRTAAQ